MLTLQHVSTNSERRQGVCLTTKGKLKINGTVGGKFALWEDYGSKGIEIEVLSQGKDGIWVWNSWEDHHGVCDSCHHGAAMIIEEGYRERTYYCNDGHPDDDFDDIIFRISGIY